ncbi:MAG: succinate dehydrogenase hydrophobic membrane anchor subunit [Mycobacterium sp.]
MEPGRAVPTTADLGGGLALADRHGSQRRRDGFPHAGALVTRQQVFMRVSGAVLILMVLGHLFVGLIAQDGVFRIDFNYIAGRWASPLWRTWDLAMLWLAQLHGSNGMATIISDYARKKPTRVALQSLMGLSTLIVLGIGTYAVLTFNPNVG